MNRLMVLPLMIEGRATVIENPHAVVTAATRIALRYVGPDKADEYGRLNGGDGMMAVRITPEKIVSEDNITDITGIAVGTTRTRADAGEHRPSLQRGQPRPVADRRRVRTSAVPAVPERTLDPEPDLVAEQRPACPGDAGGHEHEDVS
jgi:hypothetical protein